MIREVQRTLGTPRRGSLGSLGKASWRKNRPRSGASQDGGKGFSGKVTCAQPGGKSEKTVQGSASDLKCGLCLERGAEGPGVEFTL